jgi:hypothetical protein
MIPKGITHYVVIDSDPAQKPIFVFASYHDDSRLGFWRFDNESHVWVYDPAMISYLNGNADRWIAALLTEAQAQRVLASFGGTLFTEDLLPEPNTTPA